MFDTLKVAAFAAAMALVPAVASATTTLAPGGSYDLLADDFFFDGQFNIGDAGNTYTIAFTNSSDKFAAISILGATVQQLSAAFTDGVTFTFGSLDPVKIAQDVSSGFETSLTVAAGETVNLSVQFGQVVDTGVRKGGVADIDFAVEAAVVPVPAAGLLLLTAMGGLAAMRRRKTVA
ncbi:VPLPA-CTERM sorting domain-containing protein [Rubellimicrobium roseum]|nr:VPLPA-CTERM sorting domain-containing protein [Rubellimicrobium roseum]